MGNSNACLQQPNVVKTVEDLPPITPEPQPQPQPTTSIQTTSSPDPPATPEPQPKPAPEPEPRAQAKPAEPRPSPAKKQSLVIEFDLGEIIEVTEKPFGCTLDRRFVKTLEEGGCAQKAGVQIGWEIKKIGGVTVTQDKGVGTMLKKAMDPLPSRENREPGLYVQFTTKCGYTKMVTFTRVPLGIKFDRNSVTEVVPMSEAERIGVKPGYRFKSIEHSTITSRMSTGKINTLLMNGSSSLLASDAGEEYEEYESECVAVFASEASYASRISNASTASSDC